MRPALPTHAPMLTAAMTVEPKRFAARPKSAIDFVACPRSTMPMTTIATM